MPIKNPDFSKELRISILKCAPSVRRFCDENNLTYTLINSYCTGDRLPGNAMIIKLLKIFNKYPYGTQELFFSYLTIKYTAACSYLIK